MKTEVSGLDLGPTLAWYGAHQDELLARVLRVGKSETELSCELRGDPGHTRLSAPNIARLLSAFPSAAQRRSHLAGIRFEGPRWFHRDSAQGKPIPTENVAEALSPTAIIPSRVVHEPAENDVGFTTSIVLFRIPNDVAPRPVQWLIHAQGLVHEYGHSVLTPEIHRNLALRRRSGEVIRASSNHLLEAVPAIVDSQASVSHYASAYYEPDGTLPVIGVGPSPEQVNRALTAVNEVMAEAIAAYLLGFTFRLDGDGLNPFHSRAALYTFVEEYLHAERVAAEA